MTDKLVTLAGGAIAAAFAAPVSLPVMGAVAAAALVAAGVGFYFLTREPDRPIPIEPPAGQTVDKLVRDAQAALGIDPVKHYNIAFCGSTGGGKSSLVNMFLSLNGDPKDAKDARVGVTECTMEPTKYDHPTIPHLKLWDIPGAGTEAHSATAYFADKHLYAFDVVLVISAGRFMEVSQQIAEGASKYNRTIAFVWSKADTSVKSILRKNRGMSEADARLILRREVEESFVKNGLSEKSKLFLVSAWNWADGKANFDELALRAYLDESSRARHS
eukprot:m.86442 g.86442  ORF g.86442 m.86442 type:complete len:274 (+) comp50920_c0_seq1:3-824(+)